LTSYDASAWVYSIGSEKNTHCWKKKNGGPENPPL
jgi:hypothetical protein